MSSPSSLSVLPGLYPTGSQHRLRTTLPESPCYDLQPTATSALQQSLWWSGWVSVYVVLPRISALRYRRTTYPNQSWWASSIFLRAGIISQFGSSTLLCNPRTTPFPSEVMHHRDFSLSQLVHYWPLKHRDHFLHAKILSISHCLAYAHAPSRLPLQSSPHTTLLVVLLKSKSKDISFFFKDFN